MATLDHIVINTLHDMDAAAACFTALGFALTPLGRHSHGSINHLMMTPGPYLELVGVPATGLQRQDVLESPFGLNGLVLRSANADATAAQLLAAGVAAHPPTAFSRPVEIAGEMVAARFRTVRVATEIFPAGRVYYCEHLTPDYVWRDEWFAHPNGFCGIDGLVVASRDPATEARRYAAACGTVAVEVPGGSRLRLGAFTIDIVEGPVPRFIGLGLRFTALDTLARRAQGLPDARWDAHADHAATLTLPAFALRLDCRVAE